LVVVFIPVEPHRETLIGRPYKKCMPSMDPRLRELAALSGLAAVGCGFHPSRTA
jgi:hypothetical protein